MADAKRDANMVTTLIGVSSSDGITPVTIYVDPVTHRMLVSASAAAPAGSDTQVQFNDGGAMAGDSGLVFNKTTNVLTAGGLIVSALTASEIVATDGSKNLVSLAVATYPSLTELTYVKGVTSALQTQINAKAPSTSPTFGTSITGSYLTASEILITDGSKNIVSAAVATYPSLTELTYVKGVTSAIQTQLGLLAPKANPIFTATMAYFYRAITALRTLDGTDHIIDVTANTFTVTLPTAVGIQGRVYIIKNSGTGVVTIDTTSSQTIDGSTTYILSTQYSSVTVVSDNANWKII